MTRKRGLTLVELLVVMAIIGILAAMVFPVFARARNAARAAACVSNMKAVSLAMQMYLQDHKMTTPPTETRRKVAEWFHEVRGESDRYPWPSIATYVTQANPYLRWPVVLDPYVKSRAIWTCPAAKTLSGATVIVGWPDWYAWWQSFDDPFGHWPCTPHNPGLTWPSGWGGTVTDSRAQGYVTALGLHEGGHGLHGDGDGVAPGTFIQTIGPTDWPNLNIDTSVQVTDPGWFVLFSDMGAGRVMGGGPAGALFPEVCKLNYCGDETGCCSADYDECPWTQRCGISWAQKQDPDGPLYNAIPRERYTRHMGGVNLGFADGSARWMKSEDVLAQLAFSRSGYDFRHCRPDRDSLTGSLGCTNLL